MELLSEDRTWGGHFIANLVLMLEQKKAAKEYFFRAGQCAVLSSFRAVNKKRVGFSSCNGKKALIVKGSQN